MRFACIALAGAAVMSASSLPELDQTFSLLYNYDFDGCIAKADSYTRAYPDDPMGYSARAAAYLFSEMHRLKLLGKEFMTSDDKIKSKERQIPKEAARREFHTSADKARELALAKLAQNPADAHSLLAMTIVAGLERDNAALVEKRLRASLDFAKVSQQYAKRLIAADPEAYDAYFTFGFSEYLIGSLPFFARWFMKMDGIQGDKAKGLQELETAADKGRFLKPFARMMLAMFYTREKRPQDTRRHLEALAASHPGNPAVKAELAKMGAATR